MKHFLTIAIVTAVLIGCGAKPIGHPKCWTVTAVISHDVARSNWFYLKLKDPDTEQQSHLDTIIFRPYAIGDQVCIQKYDDKGISVVKYIPVP